MYATFELACKFSVMFSDIPQVAIATHIDIATKETKDVKNVFKSDYLERKVSLDQRFVLTGSCSKYIITT